MLSGPEACGWGRMPLPVHPLSARVNAVAHTVCLLSLPRKATRSGGRRRPPAPHKRRRSFLAAAPWLSKRVHKLTAPWLSGDAGGELSVADLMAGLGPERAKLGAARKALERLGRRAAPVAAPLPDRIAARKLRQAGCALGFPWYGLAAPGCVRLEEAQPYGMTAGAAAVCERAGCQSAVPYSPFGTCIPPWAWAQLGDSGLLQCASSHGLGAFCRKTCLLTCLFVGLHLDPVTDFKGWLSRPTPACACKTTWTCWQAGRLVAKPLLERLHLSRAKRSELHSMYTFG